MDSKNEMVMGWKLEWMKKDEKVESNEKWSGEKMKNLCKGMKLEHTKKMKMCKRRKMEWMKKWWKTCERRKVKCMEKGWKLRKDKSEGDEKDESMEVAGLMEKRWSGMDERRMKMVGWKKMKMWKGQKWSRWTNDENCGSGQKWSTLGWKIWKW